jgi:hypothetical protein
MSLPAIFQPPAWFSDPDLNFLASRNGENPPLVLGPSYLANSQGRAVQDLLAAGFPMPQAYLTNAISGGNIEAIRTPGNGAILTTN